MEFHSFIPINRITEPSPSAANNALPGVNCGNVSVKKHLNFLRKQILRYYSVRPNVLS